MTISPLAKKLGIKAAMRALIVSAPTEYMDLLAPLPEVLTVSQNDQGPHDFIQFFVTHLADLNKSAPNLLKQAANKASVWITYPKKTSGIKSDLHRDIIREAIGPFGWHTVSIIAIDDVWSALRIRPD